MYAAPNRDGPATHDCSTVHSQQSRCVLLICQVIFQLFRGTDFKITGQQELFSYLETLFFSHVAFCIHEAIFPFHRDPQSKFLRVEQRQSIVSRSPVSEREKELFKFQYNVTMCNFHHLVLLLLEQREAWSMPNIWSMPEMKEINKHKKPSRVSNFFIAFSVTCDLRFVPAALQGHCPG